MKAKHYFSIFVFFLIVFCGYTETFMLYTYHDKAPYYEHIHDVPGIYSDFAAFLNSKQNTYHFQIYYLPRIRLQLWLEQGILDGAVIGVNPLWFNDAEKKMYLWTSAFMDDKDIIVVKRGHSFDYTHPNDLIGKRLSLPRGQYFWGVSELVAEGKIYAEETSSDLQNMLKVSASRSDATITSILSYKHYMPEYFADDELAFLPHPHDTYSRMLLFPQSLGKEYDFIEDILNNSSMMEDWLKTLDTYNYSSIFQEK